MIDKRLDFVMEDSSWVQIKKHLKEMFEFHGFNFNYADLQTGLFYDTASIQTDFDDGARAYTITSNMKISDLDLAPKKIEALLLDLMATNTLNNL